MATIQEVAQKAGVSVATVSRVLNTPEKVSMKARAKVEEAIQALSYEPSALGRNLRNSESRLLLVILPTVSNPFYSEIIRGIEDTAVEQGYNILLCQTDSKPEREAIYFNMVRNRLADGIILMDPTVNQKNLHELASKYPVVRCSEFDEDQKIPFVSIDNELAAYQAVRHLLKLGHRKVALINSDEKYLYARERRAGYERVLKEFDIQVEKKWIYHASGVDFESGQKAMRALLRLDDRPTAVFAVSDMLAIGALKEVHASGYRVPDDIAIIGFDKVSFSNMTFPSLTTVSQPMYRMGCVSAEMIIGKIRGEEVESLILDHELIIRETT